jgi:hypothetical protein
MKKKLHLINNFIGFVTSGKELLSMGRASSLNPNSKNLLKKFIFLCGCCAFATFS